MRSEGLRMSFGGQVVLDDVDLELRQGEVVLLRGENGSGKTTLLNILTGNLEPDSGTISYFANGAPRIYRFPRHWWQELNPFDHFTPEFVACEGVGRTWQDVRLFGSLSLRDNVAVANPENPGEKPVYALFAPWITRKRETRIRREAGGLIERLGLSSSGDVSADRISLGQSKRVAVARAAVTAGTRVLFLDEPFAGLDRQGMKDVLALLETLKQEYRLTFVIIEHAFHFDYLRDFITTDWLLADGKITRSAIGPRVQRRAAGIDSPVPRPAWLPQFVDPDSVVIDEPLANCAFATRVRHAGFPADGAAPVLSIEGVEVKRGNRAIRWDTPDGARGLTLKIHRGEVVFLQAPNGWGKTTLIEGIAGLLPASSGAIRMDGVDLKGMKPWQRANAGIRIVQAKRNVFRNVTGKEMLLLAGASGRDMHESLPLHRLVSKLSGGQRQQLALTASQRRGLACIYIYDEPFSMLDIRAIGEFRSLFLPDPRYAVLVTIPSN
jgi:branched-chain amino acid transport system ATP-binding protein